MSGGHFNYAEGQFQHQVVDELSLLANRGYIGGDEWKLEFDNETHNNIKKLAVIADNTADAVHLLDYFICSDSNEKRFNEKMKVFDQNPTIAGALFDFAGFLSAREQPIEVGSTADATVLVGLLVEFARARGLILENAQVLDWQKNL